MIYFFNKILNTSILLKYSLILISVLFLGFIYNSTRIYNINDGLLDNVILDIEQDNLGQLWVVTESGISVFNGSEWISYSTRFNHLGNPFGLILKEIKKIRCDKSGNKYFLTWDGYIISLNELGARILASPLNDKNGYTDLELVNENGAVILYASSLKDGLSFYANGWFSFTEKEGLISNRIIAIKSFDDFLAVLSDKGIQFLKNRRVIYTFPTTYFVRKEKVSITFDKSQRTKGEIPSIFILADNQLLKLVNEKLEDLTYKFYSPYREKFNEIYSKSLNQLFLISDYYVKMIDLESNSIQLIENDLNAKAKITKFFIDTESNLWIGTEKGLIRKTTTSLVSYTVQNGLAENQIYAIAKQNDELYLGHKSGKITIFKNNKFEVFDLNSDLNRLKTLSGKKNEIRKIVSNGSILFLLIDDWGIFEFKRFSRLKPIIILNDAREKINDIILTKNNQLIIAGNFLFDSKIKRLISNDQKLLIDENKIPFAGEILKLYQSRDGALSLVSQEQKVFKFSKNSFEETDVLNKMNATKINFILEDRGTNISFGTDKGILMFLKSGEVKILQIPASENHNRLLEVYSGYFDELNNLWALTNQGLIFWNWREVKYSSEWRHILPSVYNNYAIISENGNLYVASDNGLHLISKDEKSIKALAPTVFITEIRINGNSQSLVDKIKVEGIKDLVIKFNGILLSSNDNIRFSYKLEGWDEDWSEPTSSREARYTNLPSGTYKFYIRAKTNLTDWSSPAISNVVNVSKPFYKNYWVIFIVLLSLILLAFLFLFIQRRKTPPLPEIGKLKNQLENLEKQNKELRVEISKALNLSRSRMSFIANLSHELRTPITSLIGFVDILLDPKLSLSEEEKRKYINYISVNSRRLLILINDIIDLARIDAGYLKLEESPVNINAEIRETVNLFKEKIRSKNLDLIIELDGSLETEMVLIDKSRLHQTISNFISNAIKFTEEGFIKVTSKMSESKIFISVEDSGIGIPAEDLPFIFEEFRRSSLAIKKSIEGTGLGLTITRKIVELMGGKIDVESAEGLGSKFMITFPLKRASEMKSSREMQRDLN